ncbi:MAG: glucose/arabinose dehydrogenase [Planctomycetota bacterium]|jgi:glucose/arabinose dehydrogenase
MLRSVIFSAVTGMTLATVGVAQNLPTNFVADTLISSGLQAGHDFSFLPDGRVLIANRGGLVQVWAGTGNPVTVGTVSSVETGSERGLLSIEADPNFATNGYFYVWWSSNSDSFMHLDRFTCTGQLSNPTSTSLSFSTASRRVIINSAPDSAFNHNGGSCRFGPDGMLYLSIGDDASSCSAQSLTSKRGCLLRMDLSGLASTPSNSEPSYSSIDPGNNPMSAATNWTQLVIAYGLRNPFRMEIDQVTGNCYIGDVGLSQSEEYSEYVINGGSYSLINFGWPWREGFGSGGGCGGGAPGGLLNPIAAVTSGSWNSIVGGPRYRNQGGAFDFGASYEGDAFYMDYFSGQVRRITNNGASWSAAPAVPGQVNATDWANGMAATVSMRQGPDGAIYYLQHNGTYATNGGSFKRIRPLGPTNSVTAISGGDQIGPAGEVYPTPLVAQVLDTNGQPLPNGTINFSVTGGHTLSTTNPVIADGNGFAQTSVTGNPIAAGAFTVTGSTPGSQTNAEFGMFSRKLTATGIMSTSTLLILSTVNQTQAVPAQIPYIVFMSFPGSQTVPTPIGPICTDPSYALTVVLEDGTGAFGGVSISGSGAIGTPSKTWLYSGIPNFLLAGQQMRFQAVGFDPVSGWFRTNCELEQF